MTYHYQIKYNRKSRISQYYFYLLAIQSCVCVDICNMHLIFNKIFLIKKLRKHIEELHRA